MPTRRKSTAKKATPPPPPEPEIVEAANAESEAEDEEDTESALDEDTDIELAEEEDEEDELLEEEDEEDEELEEEKVAKPAVAVRPAPRPTPGRPPSAKEEPEPPFSIGERVVLVRNTRPRTGTPIGDHPVGAVGRVETVLSQTAIVRFDRAPDAKEVVAFTCLESIDDEAKARRAEREKELARLAAQSEG